MVEAPENVALKIANLPESPGVYLWKDAEGKILYVGKAKRLRSRVRSYFASDHVASVKTQALVRQVADLAEMSRQMLSPERMVAFLARSNKLLTELAQK